MPKRNADPSIVKWFLTSYEREMSEVKIVLKPVACTNIYMYLCMDFFLDNYANNVMQYSKYNYSYSDRGPHR